MSPQDVVIDLKNLSKRYGMGDAESYALKDFDLTVKRGEFIMIMGPSGCGKTTLLNIIGLLDKPTDGEYLLGGKQVTRISDRKKARLRAKKIGVIFQDFNLLDTLKISENIALALAINKRNYKEIDGCVKEMAKKLNISDILDKYPYQVSGGQKQRCACARALINNPKLILADEPTGALDSNSALMFLSTIKDINEQMKATILMVTHDAFSASFANRILVLKDGKIYKELHKEGDKRKAFFDKILGVLTIMGDEQQNVH